MMPSFHNGAVEIAYLDEGEGEPIVLVHGFASTAAVNWVHPGWFTTLHARYQTPANSILFVGAITFAFSLVGMVGVGKQEAFQLLWNGSAIFYALTYLVMFALPLTGLNGVNPPPPLWLRLAAVSGFLMTLLYVTLSILPIVNVASRTAFALKICGVIAIANAIGVALYRSRAARS